ncbi:MAG TPA: response regulator transcription factor [Gemmatimonadaceae bacterium]|nr:response regulator transcription factor [Gemmatimonadaceae bacterium]
MTTALLRDSPASTTDRSRPPSVLLVEKHALIRAGLRSLIEAIPGLSVVAEAADMAGAVDLAREHQPDAILFGATAWARGADLRHQLHRELPQSCVLVIGEESVAGESAAGESAADPESGGPAGQYPGGYCCLPREAGIQEFCAAMSSLLGGRCADCRFRRGTCPAMQNVALLTRRERQVAVRVAEGLTSKQIASTLGVAIRTVNTYRESLARKIGASSAAALTRFVIESGLRDTSIAGDGGL